jgi:lipopolysaccharide transport system permease protein
VATLEPAGDHADLFVAQSGAEPDERLTIIRPPRRLPGLDLAELWRYRELAAIFVWRDLSVRYKQTAIGVLWAVFQPALAAFVYTIIFGRFAKFDSGGIAYPVFVYAALLPWQLFAASLTNGANSLVANVNLITKVYFPRVLMPLSSVLSPIVDFVIACGLLVVLMAIYGEWPVFPELLLAPAFVALAVVAVLGLVLGLAAVNVRYRDVPYAIPVFLQVLPLLSGVPFAVESAPEHWQWILSLNPMTAVISGWRWAVLDAAPPDPDKFALGVGVALVLLVVGFLYFRSREPRFADTI